jgi:hypothetical protein
MTKITCLLAQKWVIEAWFVVFDVSEELLLILIIKRRLPAQHLINNSSKGPPVGGFAVALAL